MRIVRDPAHAIRPGGSWASPRRKRASINSEDGSTLLWKFGEKSDNVQQQQPAEADETRTDENSPWKVDWDFGGTNGGDGSKGGNSLWDTSEWDAGSGGWEAFPKDTPDGSLKTNGPPNAWTSGGSASVAQLSSFFDSVDARDDSTLPTAWADLKASDADTSTWSTFSDGSTQQRRQNEGASINMAVRNRPACPSTRSGFEKQWLAADKGSKDAAGATKRRVERNKDTSLLAKIPTTTTDEPTRPTNSSIENCKDIRSDTESSSRSVWAKKETSEAAREQRDAVNAIDVGIVKGAADMPTTNTTSKSTNPFDELSGDSFERDITNTNKNPFDDNEHSDGSIEQDMTNTTSKSTNPFDNNEHSDGSLKRGINIKNSMSTKPLDNNGRSDDALAQDMANTTSKSTNSLNDELSDDSLDNVMVGTLRSRRHNKNSSNKTSINAKQNKNLPSESESITCQSAALEDRKPQRDGRSPPASPARSVDRRKALKQLKEETSGSSQLGKDISGRFHWSSGKLSCELSDEEAGHEITEIAYVLRASLTLQASVWNKDEKTSSQKQTLQKVASTETAADLKQEQQEQRPETFVFAGNDAMNSLISLNYGATEEECKGQLNLLLLGRYIIGTTPLGRNTFDVGGKYRFATRKELKATYDLLTSGDDVSNIFGTKQDMLRNAIKATLDVPEATDGSLSDSIVYTAIVSSHAEKNDNEGKRCIIRRVRHILQFVVGPDQLTVRDILRLMAWCRDYNSVDYNTHGDRDLTRFDKSHTQSGELNDLLYEELRKRIRAQVRKWLSKTSWGSEENPLRCDSKGRIVSNYPEDILFVVNVEMDVARDSLSKANQIEVMIDILIEFKESIVGMRRALSAEWDDMEIEWLCSVINDSATMMEYVETYSIFGDTKQHAVLPTFELKAVRDDVIKGYREVSREATDLVAYSIMKDVQEPVMSKVFTVKWEKSGELMNCVAATLRDYYNDLLDWLPRYEYTCVVKKCIDVLVEEYISAAFAEKHEGRRFFDADAVPARLIQDRLVLLDFFSRVDYEMKGRGARRRAKKALEIFIVLSDIIDADDPEDVSDEINQFCELLGTKYGQAAIMQAQVRKTGPHNHEAHEMWDEGLYMIVTKEHENCQLDVDLDHLLEVKEASSFPFSYSGSRTVDTYGSRSMDNTYTTGTLEGVDSDTTLPTRRGCYSRTSRHDDDDSDGCTVSGARKESFASAVDKLVTVSAEGCCWALDTALELCNDLRRNVFGMEGETESEGDDNVFMSAATEDGADGIDDSDHDDESEREENVNAVTIDSEKAEAEEGGKGSNKKKLLKSPRKWIKKMNFGS